VPRMRSAEEGLIASRSLEDPGEGVHWEPGS